MPAPELHISGEAATLPTRLAGQISGQILGVVQAAYKTLVRQLPEDFGGLERLGDGDGDVRSLVEPLPV